MTPETLEQEQSVLREKSVAVRKRTQKQNARSPRKKQVPRARVSEKTLLVLLAQDSRATGRDRLDAIKLLLQLGGKLPAEEPKNDEPQQAAPASTFRGADLAPARPV